MAVKKHSSKATVAKAPTQVSKSKYQMSISLNALNHLGMNLYSNIPAVLSEVVANAYDADATEVLINIKDDLITIEDNGHGMTISDINDKFLCVGYQRRQEGEELSETLKRPVMGRKGIGKLSLFSIADNIEIHTVRKNEFTGKKEKNGFVLNKPKIIKDIKEKNGHYYPEEVPANQIKITSGTLITITKFKKNVAHTEGFLKRRLARRFSVIGTKFDFNVLINNEPITLEDRDYFKKLQMIWIIGKDEQGLQKQPFGIQKINQLEGKIDGTRYSITGWIGTVKQAGDLKADDANNNKISIICRGKMAQEDILESFNEGGIYATYLIGEIHADFLDTDKEDDIATSSRQQINEDDPRYKELEKHVHKMLKSIQKVWTQNRLELATATAVEDAKRDSPVLGEWFDSLKDNESKNQAKKLFATIQNLPFDNNPEGKEKRKELYKQGILAFEKLRLRNSLHKLDNLQSADDVRLAGVFSELADIEANLYYDIATERVEVITEFQKLLDLNNKEKLLQKYIFDNLWLLDSSWERATAGTAVMEQRVTTEFNKITRSLSEEEKKGRLDIRYRTAAGKHIIVELKRYKPTYPITVHQLAAQAEKYRDGLQKCLKTIKRDHETIEILIILGQPLKKPNTREIEQQLGVYNARILYYDLLINEALTSYSSYLEKNKEVGRIRNLIDKL